jgi:hypothetical protein
VAGTTGTATTPGVAPNPNSRYTQCMAKAAGDIAKMQQCSSLVGQ